MQLCHQIDEEEVLDIDESVTILDLIKTFLSKTRLCNQQENLNKKRSTQLIIQDF